MDQGQLCSGSGRSQMFFEFTVSATLLSLGRTTKQVSGRRIALVDD
jgi:hypothetical protein